MTYLNIHIHSREATEMRERADVDTIGFLWPGPEAFFLRSTSSETVILFTLGSPLKATKGV